MRVVYVSTEIYPALKTGGLADVNGALPAALRAAGADVRLLLPAFPAIEQATRDSSLVAKLKSPVAEIEIQILRGRLDGVPVYLLAAGQLFARHGNPYVGPAGQDWPDNDIRFALLGWGASQFSDGVIDGWRVNIVHAHDWHAGLAPAYLAAREGRRAASVFTVHNLGFQGQFPAETFAKLGLPAGFFSMQGVEFHGNVNFMKAGLHYADRITTVSPSYAREIQTPEFGFGMDGVLRSRARALTGILNGVDRNVWSPETDPMIAAHYKSDHAAAKAQCASALRLELGLAPATGPLFGIVSRLNAQKGLDLVLENLPELIELGGQLVMLGSGEAALEMAFTARAKQYPRAIAVRIGYDEALAHRIMAASDVVLVPSRFEPCGLTQMYAMAYGALPLVRNVGGLADSVVDASADNIAAGRATGFVFEHASAGELQSALRRAFELWTRPGHWARVRETAMRQDYSWTSAARRYLELYNELKLA